MKLALMIPGLLVATSSLMGQQAASQPAAGAPKVSTPPKYWCQELGTLVDDDNWVVWPRSYPDPTVAPRIIKPLKAPGSTVWTTSSGTRAAGGASAGRSTRSSSRGMRGEGSGGRSGRGGSRRGGGMGGGRGGGGEGT